MAGAGVYQGTTTGSLVNFFAPIMPAPGPEDARRCSGTTPSLLTYIPNSYAQTTIESRHAAELERAEGHLSSRTAPTRKSCAASRPAWSS